MFINPENYFLDDDQASDKKRSKRGLLPAFHRGYKRGVTGLVTGAKYPKTKDEGFFETLAALGGEAVSDLPAMGVGAEVGGALGSLGGPIGSGTAATVGSFVLPTVIKQSFAEYREHAKQGTDLTFGEFLERAGRTAKETGKSALLGGFVGKAARFLPQLKAVPGMSKILNTRLGEAVGKGALEAGALTGGQAAIEGEIPSLEQVGQNIAMVGGMHAAGAGVRKLGVGRVVKPVVGKLAETVSHVNKLLPESIQNKAAKLGSVVGAGKEVVSKIRKNTAQKQYFEMLEDHLGKRDAGFVESQFKWKNALEKAESQGKFTPKQLEEMMYYRQKTGNPFVEGDTSKALAKRLPEHAREFVDKTIHKHFKESLKTWNENPVTKDINPREALENIYLPGLYKYDPKKFARAYDEVTRQFKTKNPFSNEKKFLSYLEAFKERGLEPRYKNIVDLMDGYDRIMIKSMANNELLDTIKKHEKQNNVDLVVNASEGKKYREAKAKGYIPFDDLYLRRSVTGFKDGKPEYGTSSSPALVSPDFSEAFQGVFKKDAYKPGGVFWDTAEKAGRAYDTATDKIRFARVGGSLFHYGALAESSFAGRKGVEGLRFPKIAREGRRLRADEPFMKDAALHGLNLGKVEPKIYKQGQQTLDKAADWLVKKNIPGAEKGMGYLKRGVNYLFDEFHPNLKATTWREQVDSVLNKRMQEGNPASAEEIKTIKKELAQLVNNMYGGQRWESMKVLNDPKVMKGLRRLVGYPDWTTSAARQAADFLAPGVKGDASFKYWVKYGLGQVLLHGLFKYLNSGWQQTDPNDSPSGLTWSPEKAYEGLTQGDPSKWDEFPMPDVNIRLGGVTFNPGRDRQGKKLFGHMGKQAREIYRYRTDPISNFFSKSAPLIQMVGTQIMGGRPYGGGIYPAQGVFKQGQLKAWGGTEHGTAARGLSRGKEAVESTLPFTVSTLMQRGVAPTIVSGLGGHTITQGISKTKAEPLLEKAMKNKDVKEVKRIRKAHRDNNYSERSVKSTITKVRNRLKK